ncbi:MAG: GntR family transcriptional regulator [Burkholderiaceae bacterium]
MPQANSDAVRATASRLQGDNRLPRYQRIADVLRRQIIGGVLKPGDQVPSENDLARDYDIAAGTARQALAQLVSDGLLERIHGKGSFVRRPNFDRSLFRFFRFLGGDDQQLVPASKILSMKTRSAPVAIGQRLNLPSKARVICIHRLRLLDNKPVLLEEIWLPLARFAPLLKLTTEQIGPLLYPVYEALCGATIAHANEDLTIENADPTTCKALSLTPSDPVVVIDRVATGFDKLPLEWRRSKGRADQFHYRIELS